MYFSVTGESLGRTRRSPSPNPKKSKVEYIEDPEEYVATLMDNTKQVQSILFVNEEHVAVHYTPKQDFVEPTRQHKLGSSSTLCWRIYRNGSCIWTLTG